MRENIQSDLAASFSRFFLSPIRKDMPLLVIRINYNGTLSNPPSGVGGPDIIATTQVTLDDELHNVNLTLKQYSLFSDAQYDNIHTVDLLFPFFELHELHNTNPKGRQLTLNFPTSDATSSCQVQNCNWNIGSVNRIPQVFNVISSFESSQITDVVGGGGGGSVNRSPQLDNLRYITLVFEYN